MNDKIKTLLTLILLIPILYGMSSCTFSYFSDTEVSTGNTFTAGCNWWSADNLDVDTTCACIGCCGQCCCGQGPCGQCNCGHGLHGIEVKNVGDSDIKIVGVSVSWTPDGGENITCVCDGVWEGSEPSGAVLDITDLTLNPGETNVFTFVFDSDMTGKTFTITFFMDDDSSKTVMFTP